MAAAFLSIRAAMSLLTALVVLTVAATTFAITYSQSLDTAESLGLRFCEVLASAGRARLEDSFARPVATLEAVERRFRGPNHPLTSSAPGLSLLYEYGRDSLLMMEVLPAEVFTVALFLRDGSLVDIDSPDAATTTTGSLRFVMKLARPAPTAADSGRINATTWVFDSATMAGTEITAAPTMHLLDQLTIGTVITMARRGMWNAAVLARGVFAIPMVKTIVNGTGTDLGFLSALVSVATVERFLHALDGTPNSQFVAVDSALSVFASTLPPSPETEPTVSVATTLSAAAPAPHCGSSYSFATANDGNWTVVCRPLAETFPFAPLRAAVSDPSLNGVLRMAGGQVTKHVAEHYVTVARVRSTFRSFPLSLFVAVPEQDVLGDVFRARDVAISAVVAIFVVATALSFAVIFAVLRPLQRVADNMRRTARLREVPDEDAAPRSSLHEVQELETAYAGMNAAIRSFTRYVPRDVVKDLLASGQLCAIRMTPAKCTILFADIENFTPMCERLTPDTLSSLVKAYFQRMSHLVMHHGGVVDKFIGDCVMAVWGAPVAVGNAELRAALCALRIERETRVAPLSDEFGAAGEQLAVRVGVASGDVLAGNMGSEERMSYTVIGDDVNLAARLEALNKQFGTRIILADATVAALPTGVLVTRLLSNVRVKGKTDAVHAFELLGLAPLSETNGVLPRSSHPSVAGRSVADDSLSRSCASDARVIGIEDGTSNRSITLLEEALAADDNASLVVAQGDTNWAAGYTNAVLLHEAGDHAAAMDALQALEAEYPHKVGTKGEDVAARLLQEACEAALQSGGRRRSRPSTIVFDSP